MAEPRDTQKELAVAIGELEDRLDRLRAAYEQYFMGFEKIEPAVLRKDVDRRFMHLRKQNIRNTAVRFRFNVVTQKYSTYGMYWTRVCRQIEDGTFKRHLVRAAKRFGPAVGKPPQDDASDHSIDVEIGDFDPVADEMVGAAEARPPAAAPPFDPEVTPGPAVAGQRVVRPAPLPPGAKPRIVLRKREPGETVAAPARAAPAVSGPGPQGPPAMRPPAGSSPALGPMRPPLPSGPGTGPPSSSVIRPAPAAPGVRPPAASSPQIVPVAPRGGSPPDPARRPPPPLPGQVKKS